MTDHASMLRTYADLAIQVGLNLRAGQRLFIIGPLANGGASLDAAPLIRQLNESAYRAGARLVETFWGDEAMLLARFHLAPKDSFDGCSRWLPDALLEHVEKGDAVLSVYANDPDLLKDEDPQQITAVQQATARAVRPFRDRISRNATNWSIVAAAVPSWARKVFPGVGDAEATARLWDAIARLCRLDRPDPVSAWRTHLASLADRKDRLNEKRYSALKYRGPGTDLTIGLPDRHVWVSGQSRAANGIVFAPNIPTEEVFTMPHKDRVNGTVAASKPLSYGGTLIEGFSLEFVDGRVTQVTAAKGQEMLRELIATDPGAARLGEIALVPHGSPISESGLLFYNTLFDENAASHVALGAAYKFTLGESEEMSDEQFEAAGGNRSVVHVDFMIGSGELDIDGVRPDGATEAVMRSGEWVQGS